MNTAVELAKVLWNYNYLGQSPKSADVLIVIGTSDMRVPEYAAGLVHRFDYPRIVVSGGVFHERSTLGDVLRSTEAKAFAQIFTQHGIKAPQLIIENQAENTGENITCSRDLLYHDGVTIRSGHLVHKPYMERRSYATAMRQWPEIEWSVSSPELDFQEDFCVPDQQRRINDLVGDTFRILSYPAKGFQIVQTMPDEVRSALRDLALLGYNERLPSDWEAVVNGEN